MIDADHLAKARDADLLAMAELLGAKLKRVSTTELAGPCLVCAGRDRFSINRKQHLWHCRHCATGGADAISLVMHVRGCNFREAIAYLTGEEAPQVRPRTTPVAPKPVPEDNAFVEQVIGSILRELIPLRAAQPAKRYLAEARKIDTDAVADVLERTDAIGWHPSVLFREQGHALGGRRLGCIVGIMTDPVTAIPTGAISRTYLTPDLAKVGKAKTLGKPAGVVRLTPDNEVLGGLHLAEGIETALAAMSKGLRPVWATGSAALMAKFPVLSGIEYLTLVVDHDRNRAGEEAAREVEARWLSADRAVRLWQPYQFGDFNDALAGDAQ
jgi:hypothetical protein